MTTCSFYPHALVAAVLCFCLLDSAQAQIHVAPDGGGTDGATWATAFTALQPAVDAAAAAGHDVWIAEGVYPVETAVGMPGGVAVYGGFPDTGAAGFGDRDPIAHETILDGGDATPTILRYEQVSDVILDGVTVRNARDVDTPSDAPTGAVRCVGLTGTNRFVQVQFTSNQGHSGAGLSVEASELTVTGCAFTSNFGYPHGGAAYFSASTVHVADSLFTHNFAESWGGALYALESGVTVTGSEFTANLASRGAAIGAEGRHLKVVTSTLQRNDALHGPGGAIAGDGLAITIEDSVITANHAPGGGGAIGLSDSALDANGSRFTLNRTSDGRGGAISLEQALESTIARSIFSINSANGGGGAVRVESSGLLTVSQSTVEYNAAGTAGGGFSVLDTPFHLERTVVRGNWARASGGGLLVSALAPAEIDNAVFIWNRAQTGAAAVVIAQPGRVWNCTIYGNLAEHGGALFSRNALSLHNSLFAANLPVSVTQFPAVEPFAMTHCLFPDGRQPLMEFPRADGELITLHAAGGRDGINTLVPGASGNIQGDPGFVDADGGNLRLRPDSAAIDQGWADGAPALDVDGRPRGWGGGVDIGAYEYTGNDVDGDEAVSAVDIQLVVLAILGHDVSPHYPDVNSDGVVDARDLQAVINAALGM